MSNTQTRPEPLREIVARKIINKGFGGIRRLDRSTVELTLSCGHTLEMAPGAAPKQRTRCCSCAHYYRVYAQGALIATCATTEGAQLRAAEYRADGAQVIILAPGKEA